MNMIPITEICKFDKRGNWLRILRKSEFKDMRLYKDIKNLPGVYWIWENGKNGIKSKAIYIGMTGKTKRPSIRGRLKIHLDKLTGEAKYCPKNWERYRKTNPEIDKLVIGYKIVHEAKAAEVASIAYHICTFGHAPICNNEYVKNMNYSTTIESLKD